MITIDQWIANFLNEKVAPNGFPWGNFVLCTIAILLCVFLCGLVGLEREKRGRSAGLRTHLLVGFGSCIVMIISIYGFPTQQGRDVARLAAQVITGVGFLGAGAIIHNNGGIKGLTTAGTIWLVMAIGLACGSFNFILALGGTLVVMIVLITFRRLEHRVSHISPTIIVVTKCETPAMSIILNLAKEYSCTVSDVNTQIIKDGAEERLETIFTLNSSNKDNIEIETFNQKLGELTSALSVQVLNHH